MPGSVDAAGDASSNRAANPSLLQGALSSLRSAGLVDDDASPLKQSIAAPTRQIRIDWNATPAVTLADVIDLVVAMKWTASRLRRGLPCRRFTNVRTMSGAVDDVPPKLMAALDHLRDIRLVVPTPRRCLPAATIAARFLQRRGIHVDIVFGVRSHPFEAHCWIEHDGVVLDDRLDKVLAYVPIAIGAL
ncbi:lasso peptide biosynthesis B2 protein [Sphingomonas faeni]|uniref:lasso peptide biosynthesis B2 protein n=1 Tax=Sphingomonas faeni TaxID=185950 RepID=UPI0033650662